MDHATGIMFLQEESDATDHCNTKDAIHSSERI